MKTLICRRRFLFQSAMAACGISGLSRAYGEENGNKKAQPPNVVLIITDDQGYPNLHAHGNDAINTPEMDKLYHEGVRLDNFHVDPTCAPTRAALMTGCHSRRAGVWHTVMGRSQGWADRTMMPEIFADNGYKTAIFGKWHLGDSYPFRPQDRGFQHVLIHGGGGVGQTPDYWGNDYFDDTYFLNGNPQQYKGYCCDVWFDEAISFIERNRNSPFFCYVSSNTPHSPYRVPKKYRDPYSGKAGVPNAAYFGMITNLDDNIGRLRKKLEDLKLEENTILIFTSDNGPSACEYNAGMRGKKGSQYDGGHRVPFFIRWPAQGVKDGKQIDRLAAHFDVLPTLIDFCGLQKPKGLEFDGMSLKPLILGEPENWPSRTLIVESQRIDTPQKWRKCAVMTDRWRLVDGKQLYDIQADPSQRRDVSGGHPEVVQRLRKHYEQWWQSVSKNDDEYTRTIVGSKEENPVLLTAHDWHPLSGGIPPWNQTAILAGKAANGFWTVEVVQDGLYEIALLRWPPEAKTPIKGSTSLGGRALDIEKARLKINDFDDVKPVETNAEKAEFTVKLKAGPARVQTWFYTEDGKDRGAYYVHIKRI